MARFVVCRKRRRNNKQTINGRASFEICTKVHRDVRFPAVVVPVCFVFFSEAISSKMLRCNKTYVGLVNAMTVETLLAGFVPSKQASNRYPRDASVKRISYAP